MRLVNAKNAAIEAIRPHVQRLSERVVEKTIREEIFRHLPRRTDIGNAAPINISIDVATIVTTERSRLQQALDNSDLSAIISRYPIRETAALNEIASKLGFQKREQYEGAVRKLLMDDNGALIFVKSLFGALEADINAV